MTAKIIGLGILVMAMFTIGYIIGKIERRDDDDDDYWGY